MKLNSPSADHSVIRLKQPPPLKGEASLQLPNAASAALGTPSCIFRRRHRGARFFVAKSASQPETPPYTVARHDPREILYNTALYASRLRQVSLLATLPPSPPRQHAWHCNRVLTQCVVQPSQGVLSFSFVPERHAPGYETYVATRQEANAEWRGARDASSLRFHPLTTGERRLGGALADLRRQSRQENCIEGPRTHVVPVPGHIAVRPVAAAQNGHLFPSLLETVGQQRAASLLRLRAEGADNSDSSHAVPEVKTVQQKQTGGQSLERNLQGAVAVSLKDSAGEGTGVHGRTPGPPTRKELSHNTETHDFQRCKEENLQIEATGDVARGRANRLLSTAVN
ncbi:unnamed protein product [Rangifer tarandus platyrhynchus]|uniref:Uncharacterized protein n=1 Tax=Rangifer tarandus platyrhynchus TaxID=3082113 RepID=A0ABN8XIL2_RANTA|nr:unnamed protein product [Rangifer tarandus platyrhynchus]